MKRVYAKLYFWKDMFENNNVPKGPDKNLFIINLLERLQVLKQNTQDIMHIIPIQENVEDTVAFLENMESVQEAQMSSCREEDRQSLEETLGAMSFLKQRGLPVLMNGTEKNLSEWSSGVFYYIEGILRQISSKEYKDIPSLRQKMFGSCQSLTPPARGRCECAAEWVENQYASLTD